MCSTCGCDAAGVAMNHGHAHDGHEHHGHEHHGHEHHDHEHHGHAHHGVRRVELGQAVLAHNDAHAAQNRRWLDEQDVRAVDILSSPGSGKTTLLEATLDALSSELRIGLIVGDVATDRDAQRLAGRGAVVHAIETGGSCHLDAHHIGELLPGLPPLDLLLIENVGNLVCPAAFDLGQHLRVALLSVTEGEDKPLKYPALFHRSPVVLLTKCDLIPHLRWSRDETLANLRRVRPDVRVIEVSAQTGQGVDEWLTLLRDQARV